MDRTAWAAQILGRVKYSQKVRLAHGSKLRKELHEKIQRGEQPTGYRANWLRESSMLVVDFLQDLAKGFNRQYPNDCCSVNDLIDVLSTTIGQFKKYSKE